jgi:hypothetical protein
MAVGSPFGRIWLLAAKSLKFIDVQRRVVAFARGIGPFYGKDQATVMANVVINTSVNIGGELSKSTIDYLSSTSYVMVGVSMA